MRGFLNSVLATLLVLVLLIVAPLLVVFGIPEFVPVVALSSQDVTEAPRSEVVVEVGVGQSARCEPHDLFASLDEELPPSAVSAFDVQRIPVRSRVPAVADTPIRWDVDDRGRVVRTASTTETGFTTATTSAVSAEEYHVGDSVSIDGPATGGPRETADVPESMGVDRVTWQSAVRRLNELGISDYNLTRGRDGRDFRFTCAYEPGGDLAGRRFEAAAPEPLLAVRHVLLQIDDWNARRR